MAFWGCVDAAFARGVPDTVKFGIGQPLKRYEDQRRLTGKARYTDDISLPRMVFGAVLRSPMAHARVTRLDAAARRMPRVLLVLTGDEVKAERLGDVPCVHPLESRAWEPLRRQIAAGIGNVGLR
jgi:aerobic carbon-monoxide dehydrogenase large subunit